MTLEDTLQILGGIGVFASIAFLGVQIRSNARALRASTRLPHPVRTMTYEYGRAGASPARRQQRDISSLKRRIIGERPHRPMWPTASHAARKRISANLPRPARPSRRIAVEHVQINLLPDAL